MTYDAWKTRSPVDEAYQDWPPEDEQTPDPRVIFEMGLRSVEMGIDILKETIDAGEPYLDRVEALRFELQQLSASIRYPYLRRAAE